MIEKSNINQVAGHGGEREGAGRPAGTRNKATAAEKATLAELARQHTDLALGALVRIASEGSSESAAIAAATALLDRGYGRPRQAQEEAEPPAAHPEPIRPNVVSFKDEALKYGGKG